MRTIKSCCLIVLILVSTYSYCQGDLKYSEKLALRRANKHINTNSNIWKLDSFDSNFQIDLIKKSLVNESPKRLYYQILNKYARLITESVSLDSSNNILSLSNTKDTASLKTLLERVLELKALFEIGDKAYQPIVKRICKRYDKLVPRITEWETILSSRITQITNHQKEIKKIQESEKIKQQAIDNLEIAKHHLALKIEYQDTLLLINTINEIYKKIEDALDSARGNRDQFKVNIIAERKGLNGRDLYLTVSAYYEEEYKYFDNGQYQSPKVDMVFKKAISVIVDKIDDSLVVQVSIIGTADANPTGESNLYKNKSLEWGTIHEMLEDGTAINLKPNQRISNKELAFLRAYNIKVMFEKFLRQNCVHSIEALDYLELNPNYIDEIGTYRNVIAKIYIFDFFKKGYEVLFDTIGIGIDDNLDQKYSLPKKL